MGRRRRKKVVKIFKRELPKYFTCPRCGRNTVQVQITSGLGQVRCSLCGLKSEIQASPSSQPVDIYCQFTDIFYAGRIT